MHARAEDPSSSDLESLPQPSEKHLDDGETYPEGGLSAWLVVLGAWCGLTASLGIYDNTAGAFEAVVSSTILPDESPSKLGLFFSTYAFVMWICGVQIGPTFDDMGPKVLMAVGWGSTVRIVSLVLCALSVMLCRSQIQPRKGAETTWKDTRPDPRVFLDGTGGMVGTTIGVLLTDLAYFIPVTYVPSCYSERQQLSHEAAVGGSAAFAFQLLAILNVASCVDRYVAGNLADRFVRYNTLAVSLFFCAVSVLCFWLPDILLPNLDSYALLVVFVLLFGLVSGSNVSLTPICFGQLCDTREYGRYYASCYTVVAFGVLGRIPIAGSLLDAIEASGKERFLGVTLFTVLSYVGALCCFAWVRIRVEGWNWRTKW